MQKYSFLENIEQAVCLIGLVYHNNKHEDTFIVQFNSYFKQNFPEVDESNVFDKFSDDFKTNVLDAFSREEDDSAFDFIYQDINYQVLKIKLDSNQYAFLFKMISRLGKSKNYQDIDLLKGGNIAGLNFLAETFDKASIMVVVTNLKGKIEYVNEEFTKLTEYTSEEAVGRNANILNSGKQLPEFYQQMWATLYEGKVWNNSFHNRKKTGQLYWQRTYMIPLTDESGKITRFVALGEDITESKAVETVVEEKTDLLFQLLEGTPDIVCVKDGDGRWLMANSSMKKLFELEKVSFYGKTTIELAEYSKHHKESLLSSLATDIEAWTTKTLNRKDEIIPESDGLTAQRMLTMLRL